MVLIVDDDYMNLDVMQRMFEKMDVLSDACLGGQ